MLFENSFVKRVRVKKVFLAFYVLFFATPIVYGTSIEIDEDQKSSRVACPDPNYNPDPNYDEHEAAIAVPLKIKKADEIKYFEEHYTNVSTNEFFQAALVLAQSDKKDVKSYGLQALLWVANDRDNFNSKKAAEVVAKSDSPEMARLGENALIEIKWVEENASKITPHKTTSK